MREITLDESVEIKVPPRTTRKNAKPKILKLHNGKRYDIEKAVNQGYDSKPINSE